MLPNRPETRGGIMTTKGTRIRFVVYYPARARYRGARKGQMFFSVRRCAHRDAFSWGLVFFLRAHGAGGAWNWLCFFFVRRSPIGVRTSPADANSCSGRRGVLRQAMFSCACFSIARARTGWGGQKESCFFVRRWAHRNVSFPGPRFFLCARTKSELDPAQ